MDLEHKIVLQAFAYIDIPLFNSIHYITICVNPPRMRYIPTYTVPIPILRRGCIHIAFSGMRQARIENNLFIYIIFMYRWN